MTLIITQVDDINPRIDSKSLRGDSFYHFRGIAVPRFNDFLFRRQMFATCWQARWDALSRILKAMKAGQFQSDHNVYRDFLAIFGTKDEVKAVLQDETNYLPPNQTHSHHAKYATLVHLCRTADPLVRQEDSELQEIQAQIDKDTPKVTDTWLLLSLALESDEEASVGPKFVAPSPQAAAKFLAEVHEAMEQDGQPPKKFWGMYALGFVDPDPGLFDPANVEKERKILLDIQAFLQAEEDSLNLNDSSQETKKLSADEAEFA